VASLSQGRTAAAQCGLFTHKSVPVIFEPPCIYEYIFSFFVVEPSLVSQSLLIIEVLRPHSVRHTTLGYNFPGREIDPT